MNVAVILEAPLAIQIHLATVLPALVIGTWQIFFSIKGSRLHRAFGFVYLGLMTITAVAAFFIRSVGHGSLSPIHLFIPLTFFGVFGALWWARRGDIEGHRRAMLGLYFGGMFLAGDLHSCLAVSCTASSSGRAAVRLVAQPWGFSRDGAPAMRAPMFARRIAYCLIGPAIRISGPASA